MTAIATIKISHAEASCGLPRTLTPPQDQGWGRRTFSHVKKLLCAVACAALVAVQAPADAHAARAAGPKADTVPLFAGAGTALTNGYFFPGTAIYQNGEFVGVPLQVPQGANIEFVNTDAAAVTNGHAIVSFKRKHGKPLFTSGLVNGPGTATVLTEKLKPGTYSYFCSIHYGMYGLIEITAP